jgi:hypothetical protein
MRFTSSSYMVEIVLIFQMTNSLMSICLDSGELFLREQGFINISE